MYVSILKMSSHPVDSFFLLNRFVQRKCKRLSDKQGYIRIQDLPDECKTVQTQGPRVHIDSLRRQLCMLPSINGKMVGIDMSRAPLQSSCTLTHMPVTQVWVQLTKEIFGLTWRHNFRAIRQLDEYIYARPNYRCIPLTSRSNTSFRIGAQ